MTLTTRLTAFFVATLTAVLVAFSATLYLVTQTQLYRELEERADSYRAMLSATVEVEDVKPVGLEWNSNAEQIKRIPAEALQWAAFDETGLVAGSAQLKVFQPKTSPDGAVETILNEQPWRIVSREFRYARPQDVVITSDPETRRYRQLTFLVAVPIAPVRDALHTLAWRLTVISLTTLLVVAFIARWVCQRALLPLRTMADATTALGTDDLTQRLPVPVVQDELHALGAAFNDLLARVHEAFERQKQFTAEASHQLRTPLTAMLGQMELALRRDRTPAEYQETIGAVNDQAARLHEMVEMLLFLARTEAEARLPHLDAVELGSWLTSYVNRHWTQHPRFTDLHVQVSAKSPLTVGVHPALFEQAVGNLLDNAFKYSDPGSPVHLRLRQQGSEAVLSLEDRGMGIDADDIPRLFTPFFRSDAARERGISGVGLGLAISARIIRALGGCIKYERHQEAGGAFTIALPVKTEDQNPSELGLSKSE
ncbi:MAG TPA: ATP-binding protein [Gemmatales bacterium]|nr:ATP-binding protein [Gemmatales bacterium]